MANKPRNGWKDFAEEVPSKTCEIIISNYGIGIHRVACVKWIEGFSSAQDFEKYDFWKVFKGPVITN